MSKIKEVVDTLKEVVNSVKMHDKDLFMLNNILDQLEDEVENSGN